MFMPTCLKEGFRPLKLFVFANSCVTALAKLFSITLTEPTPHPHFDITKTFSTEAKYSNRLKHIS